MEESLLRSRHHPLRPAMSSVTENRPPEAALLEPAPSEERYVDEQIRRTRRSLKLVDLIAGMLTLVIGVLRPKLSLRK